MLLEPHPRPPRVTVSSRVPVERSELWRRLGTLAAVNAEMAPWLRLRAPATRRLDAVPVGVEMPWALYGPLGVPLGRYPLVFVRAPGPDGFVEQTATAVFSTWHHERALVVAGPAATIVTDALAWRVRGVGSRHRLDAMISVAVGAFFRHRHRRLRGDARRRGGTSVRR